MHLPKVRMEVPRSEQTIKTASSYSDILSVWSHLCCSDVMTDVAGYAPARWQPENLTLWCGFCSQCLKCALA